MVFFQIMLLGGYAYAHFSVQKLGPRRQSWLHALLLVIAATQLPFALSSTDHAPSTTNPALWVLVTLVRSIGLPVLILASTAPLLQKWFSSSNDPSASDPYFLYAASNVGSFGALFAYPLLIEPTFRLSNQIEGWSAGFWVLAGLIILCGFTLRSRSAPVEPTKSSPAEPIKRLTIWKWIGLSFVPSSLMLGVTNYITTDVASVPLLWVIPLGLYLFTFVIAFSKHSRKAEAASSRAIPILALAVVFPMVVQATEPVWMLVLLHLLFFLFAALQAHLKLARGRPSPEHLTQFYLYLSVGGVLGGIFNSLIAPVIFTSIIEYPLMILVATLIGFPERRPPGSKQRLPPIYGGAIVIILTTIGSALIALANSLGILAVNALAGIFLLITYFSLRSPIRYVLGLGTLLLCTGMFRQSQSPVLEHERNFFGVLRVTDETSKPLRRLYHGTTIHGVQFTDPNRRCFPLSYYHPDGPVGEITALFAQTSLPRKVGLVGLGAGAMITFSQPGEEWTLYEIDPAVVRIAQDTNYFTYLSHCAQGSYKIELGDARLRLQSAPTNHFGLLYVDAFSSDVIPMHLLTVEALRLYTSRLAPGGFLAFHLSSRNFELEPLVANLGHAVGLHCYSSNEGELHRKALEEGGLESNWVILVPETMQPLLQGNTAWRHLPPDPQAPLWTDDFSSLTRVLRF